MAERPRLVVLDDDIFVALLTAALPQDYDFAVGRNGREGLELCRAGRADLLLTDIGMPELDGIQMLAEFQKDPRLAAIPVLVVTATHFTRRHRSVVARYPQVRGIICKPCSVEHILQEIQRVLQEPRGQVPG